MRTKVEIIIMIAVQHRYKQLKEELEKRSWLRAWTVLPEGLGSVLHTHMVVHNRL